MASTKRRRTFGMAGPTEPSRVASGAFIVTTGDASERPYPSTMGILNFVRKASPMGSGSGVPPSMTKRNVFMSSGDAGMIPRLRAAKVKDKKAYAKQFAKVLALASLAPLSSGVAALIVDINRRPLVPVITLAVVFIACMQKGAKMMEEVM